MVKGFGVGTIVPASPAPANYRSPWTMTRTDLPKPPSRPAVIASRKSCDAEGTGLSHYVLMDRQVTR
jgi:modified peptide precursor CbpA